MDIPPSGLFSTSSRRDDLQSPISGSCSSFASTQTNYRDYEKTGLLRHAHHTLPYRCIQGHAHLYSSRGSTATMNISRPMFMKRWWPGKKTMAFVPSAEVGSQMTSSFLPVGHTDRHEVSFEHRNDICFWANDNYPVLCILHSIPFTIIFMPLEGLLHTQRCCAAVRQ